MRRTEILLLVCWLVAATTSFAATVTYDHRALVVDGKRRVLISGSIHYPRSTPDMWPDLIQKSKDGGLDVIETYVFWNLHEPVRNQYNFEGRNDLVKFVKLVAEAGLYVHLRIGPYACAEWNYGGFPLWLHFIPGIKLRTDNEPFKAEMQRFTAKIVEMMKQENLYASQGGPIILSQIENEYGNIDSAYGAAAKPYINWAAGMAVSLDTGVPWVMCQQSDAPDPIINTCNGFYCDQFTPNSNKKPKIWTENWTGWFLSFGGAVPYRPVEDIAFAVARFYQRGGTFQNYYMINSMTVIPSYMHESLNTNADSNEAIGSSWSWINEPVGISKADAFNQLGLLEQINTTADKSDYLWYSLSTNIKGDEPFLQDGSQTVLHVESLGHALHAFINGKLAGSGTGNSGNAKVKVDIPITVVPGKNTIDLLSLTVGLQNYGAFFDLWGAGVTGPVKLNGLKNGSSIDLTSQQWTYQVGLQGEDLGLPSGSSSQWVSSTLPKNQPLIWYKTNFDAPAGNDPIALDFSGMGKGQAWVNGQSIGRYWPAYVSSNGGCTDSCNYRGPFSSSKCLKNCGKPSQQLYHVPRSWLQPSGNILVLFEENGGDPTQLAFATRQMGSLCSHVSESHPLPVDMWGLDSKAGRSLSPTLSLGCPSPNQVISSIKFASFGTPRGTCGSFSHGRCSSARALFIVQKACVGLTSCSIGVSTGTFGDPCKGVMKSLAVEVSCT
ncbi:beta-galactosidase 6 isoform X3 [Durio zibethinus]|uniref:Beta-galactosidase n=1 Tax=Durio zibethinus TaxID=66656 RepID=A0A6P5XWX9_DURZI|nr:beta-galactosidase 6 isoform X3 [Durio zibethinus]